jgi:hypothetical protein
MGGVVYQARTDWLAFYDARTCSQHASSDFD